MSTSSSSASYFYIDDDGEEQGPHDFDAISSWIAAGYFPPTLSIRSNSEQNFQPLNAHTHFKDTITQQQEEQQKDQEKQQDNRTEKTDEQEDAGNEAKGKGAVHADGEEAKDSSESSSASSSSSSSSSVDWYYIGDDGIIHGPHPSVMMAAWHAAGYFHVHTKIRSANDQEFRMLSQFGTQPFGNINQLMDVSDSSSSSSVARANGSAQSEDADIETDNVNDSQSMEEITAEEVIAPHDSWYYLDSIDQPQGPFHTRQLRLWYKNGCLDLSTLRVRRADSKSFALVSDSASNSIEWLSASDAELAQREDRWYYLNDESREEGPFTGEQMRRWWFRGLLSVELPVRQVGDEDDVFVPIRARKCGFTKVIKAATTRTQPTSYHSSQQKSAESASIYQNYPPQHNAGYPYPTYAQYPYPYPQQYYYPPTQTLDPALTAASSQLQPASNGHPPTSAVAHQHQVHPSAYQQHPYPHPYPYPSYYYPAQSYPGQSSGVASAPTYGAVAAFSNHGKFRGSGDAANQGAMQNRNEFGKLFDSDQWTEERNQQLRNRQQQPRRPPYHQQQRGKRPYGQTQQRR